MTIDELLGRREHDRIGAPRQLGDNCRLGGHFAQCQGSLSI
jgi:hypothetical protein